MTLLGNLLFKSVEGAFERFANHPALGLGEGMSGSMFVGFEGQRGCPASAMLPAAQ